MVDIPRYESPWSLFNGFPLMRGFLVVSAIVITIIVGFAVTQA
jgi:hypothetical protein